MTTFITRATTFPGLALLIMFLSLFEATSIPSAELVLPNHQSGMFYSHRPYKRYSVPAYHCLVPGPFLTRINHNDVFTSVEVPDFLIPPVTAPSAATAGFQPVACLYRNNFVSDWQIHTGNNTFRFDLLS